ncbi:MAG: uracil-DNA glycosylase [Alphaproteobacteria bacterium]|nr:uracil-DNA glycosylase [Alphaproteobacteria bacterium]
MDPPIKQQDERFVNKPPTPTIKNPQEFTYVTAALAQDAKSDVVSRARSLADLASTLEELKKFVMSFEDCNLKKAATNTVFGDGVQEASIMLIGEAPGASEDASGVPFCGESGQLLDNMLKSIGLARDRNIYISNTIFWRPPVNRVPTKEEIEICRPFVEKHIALIKPKLLVLVGATAITSLLGSQFQISKMRGAYSKYSNKYLNSEIDCTAIFHPAYLLRQPGQKKSSWEDLMKIKQFLINSHIL